MEPTLSPKCIHVSFIAHTRVYCLFVQSTSLTSKAGKELKKRDVQIADMSNTQVTVTLWGEKADERCVCVRERERAVPLSLCAHAY